MCVDGYQFIDGCVVFIRDTKKRSRCTNHTLEAPPLLQITSGILFQNVRYQTEGLFLFRNKMTLLPGSDFVNAERDIPAFGSNTEAIEPSFFSRATATSMVRMGP